MNISLHTSHDMTGESLQSIKGKTDEVNPSTSFSSLHASTTDAAKCFLWESELSLFKSKGGEEREKGRACIPRLNLAIFPFHFYSMSYSSPSSPGPFPSQKGWPQCPYTSTVPRGGCSSTLPTLNCPALPKQTDFQPLITSTESDTEEALPASVDPHSQARLREGCNGPE